MPRRERRLYPDAMAFLRRDPWRPTYFGVSVHEAFFSDLTAHFTERVLLGCRASLAKPPIYLRLLACFSHSFGWSSNSELPD